ncbi:MAG: hypothetical protein WDN69_18065 [Aliidongia sp.]
MIVRAGIGVSSRSKGSHDQVFLGHRLCCLLAACTTTPIPIRAPTGAASTIAVRLVRGRVGRGEERVRRDRLDRVVVVQHDAIVASWGEIDADLPLNSMRKSLLGALIGRAWRSTSSISNRRSNSSASTIPHR